MRLKYELLFACLLFFACNSSPIDKPKPATTSATSPSSTVSTAAVAAKAPTIVGGTYSYGKYEHDDSPTGEVLIYPTTEKTALFLLFVVRGAPSFNSGELFGQIVEKNGVFVSDTKADGGVFDCVLRFEFGNEELKIKTDEAHTDCGFGNGVVADGTYKLTDKQIPTHFDDGSGKKIEFKDLTIEQYNKMY